MSTSTGVVCECGKCGSGKWYECGLCKTCGSGADVKSTWIGKQGKGGAPPAKPSDELRLQSGATAQLIDSWTNLVLVRGLTPVMKGSAGTGLYVSPGWYRQRGVHCTVRIQRQQTDTGLGDRINRAASWTNHSFIVRLVVTFEEFAGGKGLNEYWLPNGPGMRELHHARGLRNKIAHGAPLTDSKLVKEEASLFRPGNAPGTRCELEINNVLEPLWARLLLYATRLEFGSTAVPPEPAVVVAINGKRVTVQAMGGLREGQWRNPESLPQLAIGRIVPLGDLIIG